MATSNDQLSGWTKKKLQSTFQSKFAPKEGYGQCLVGCCPSDSLQFSESGETVVSEKYAQQISEMHGKLQHLQLALINTKGPILLRNIARLRIAQPTDASEVEQTGFASLVTDYSFFNHLDN